MRKILFISFQLYHEQDIVENLKFLGNHVDEIGPFQTIAYEFNDSLYQLLYDVLSEKSYDVVFSAQYNISIAEACKDKGMRYLSWVTNTPCLEVFHKSILYPTNQVYMFDYSIYEQLLKRGVKTVQYLHGGINVHRLEKIDQKKEMLHNVSYIGSMHTEASKDYKMLMEAVSPYLQGFLEALVNVQRNVSEYNMIEQGLRNTKEIVGQLETMAPCYQKDEFLTASEYVYANYFLYPKITFTERVQMLMYLSKTMPVDVYTGCKSKIGNCINHGMIDYYSKLPEICARSRININITSRTTSEGISQHALNVIGAGGFLLTDYQKDYFNYFEPDKDIVIFTNIQELQEKVEYYLKHEAERNKILSRGKRIVEEQFSYELLLRMILEEI